VYGAAEIEAEEKRADVVSWSKNANLGRFTNFVNLLDLAAIAVPSGLMRCEVPAAASDPTGEQTGILARCTEVACLAARSSSTQLCSMPCALSSCKVLAWLCQC
jgi:hypothetical protein